MTKSTVPCIATIAEAINCLQHIIPPKGLVVVGAGTGRTAAKEWGGRQLANVLLIEANQEYHKSLEAKAVQYSGWKAITALLGDTVQTVDYYCGSNPAVNGIIPMSVLQKYWQNLEETSVTEYPQHCLEDLLQEYETADSEHVPKNNWLDLDCFPALPILKGAGSQLEYIDVIRCSMLAVKEDSQLKEAMLGDTMEYLREFGFVLFFEERCNHPAFSRVLFVKDWKAIAQELTSKKKELSQALDKQVAANSVLIKSLDNQKRQSGEHKEQIERLSRDLDVQKHLVAQGKNYIRKLSETIADMDYRQKLFSDEIIRAEGQVDLIKDILLHDPLT